MPGTMLLFRNIGLHFDKTGRHIQSMYELQRYSKEGRGSLLRSGLFCGAKKIHMSMESNITLWRKLSLIKAPSNGQINHKI